MSKRASGGHHISHHRTLGSAKKRALEQRNGHDLTPYYINDLASGQTRFIDNAFLGVDETIQLARVHTAVSGDWRERLRWAALAQLPAPFILRTTQGVDFLYDTIEQAMDDDSNSHSDVTMDWLLMADDGTVILRDDHLRAAIRALRAERHPAPSKAQVIAYMGGLLTQLREEVTDSAGCVNHTALAERALHHFPGLDGSPEADVWDWAIEAAEQYAPDANE